jgi:hypothetical protein
MRGRTLHVGYAPASLKGRFVQRGGPSRLGASTFILAMPPSCPIVTFLLTFLQHHLCLGSPPQKLHGNFCLHI